MFCMLLPLLLLITPQMLLLIKGLLGMYAQSGMRLMLVE
jgi:hypothetical protein